VRGRLLKQVDARLVGLRWACCGCGVLLLVGLLVVSLLLLLGLVVALLLLLVVGLLLYGLRVPAGKTAQVGCGGQQTTSAELRGQPPLQGRQVQAGP